MGRHGGTHTSTKMFVVPGQAITNEPGFLRGHGCLVQGDTLHSALAGQVTRVNKLITVKALKSRYIGEVGDLVVGKISSLEAKRWKVDMNAQKDANLLLSSVNLPGGVQRMRTHEDQMQMRSLFSENDLISAEIQAIGADGGIALHTRSLRYGLLENGQCVRVPAGLVKRLPQHFLSMAWGVDLLIGRNGGIWITRSMPSEWRALEGLAEGRAAVTQEDADALQRLRHRHASTPISREDRMKIARTRNAVLVLRGALTVISPGTVAHVYAQSEARAVPVKDMLDPDIAQSLVDGIEQCELES